MNVVYNYYSYIAVWRSPFSTTVPAPSVVRISDWFEPTDSADTINVRSTDREYVCMYLYISKSTQQSQLTKVTERGIPSSQSRYRNTYILSHMICTSTYIPASALPSSTRPLVYVDTE